MNEFKKAAKAALNKAGSFLLKEYDKFDRGTVRLKSLHEIVTKADLTSEEIIVKELKKRLPGHNILSEEMGKSGSSGDYLWIVDPIDGTTNFSMHNPIWSISLALAHKGDIKLGYVYAPELNELYSGEKGKGAELNGKAINVSKVKDGKVLNTFCHGSKNKDIKKAG